MPRANRASPPLAELLDALTAWQRDGGEQQRTLVARALESVAKAAGLRGAWLSVDAPPLSAVAVGAGTLRGVDRPDLPDSLEAGRPGVASHVLAPQPEASPLGVLVTDVGGSASTSAAAEGTAGAEATARDLAVALQAVHALERARRAEGNLAALDVAIRGMAGVLEIDRVLQVIVDRVRELVDAEYAALGIVDRLGQIELFITAGISDEARERIGSPPRGRGLLGALIREGRSIRVAEIADDPRRFGFPPHHPKMHAFLGVPVTARDAVVGNLYLANKRSGEFSADDQRLVERFALHAGIAIENARLHEQVGRLAVVEERDRISRDLHDGIIQRLYAVTLSLDDVPELAQEAPAEAASRVDRAIDDLHETIREVRNFIFQLQPVELEEGGLAGALQRLAEDARQNTSLDVHVSADPGSALPIDATAELLAIAREALSNTARHARATHVEVSLAVVDDELRLSVVDDGIGFDPATPRGDANHGIDNMHARARRIGGTLEVASQPGRGARIILALRLAPSPVRGTEPR